MGVFASTKRLNELLANKIVDKGEDFFSGMIRLSDKNGETSISLSKKGKAMATVAAIGGFANNAINERYNNDLGTTDGKLYTPTPTYGDYLGQSRHNGGADGSLVFALDKNKRGGYL